MTAKKSYTDARLAARLGQKDDTPVVDEIESPLRAANVGTIVHLEEQLPLEFCDDYGAPHFLTARRDVARAPA